MDMSDIETAINRYHVEFGTDPDTSSESLFATLNGANPRGLKFIDEKRLTNGIDPWGTPYGVFYSNNEWLIRSAGRDKIFNDQSLDGTDDIIFRIPKLRSNPAKSTPR